MDARGLKVEVREALKRRHKKSWWNRCTNRRRRTPRQTTLAHKPASRNPGKPEQRPARNRRNAPHCVIFAFWFVPKLPLGRSSLWPIYSPPSPPRNPRDELGWNLAHAYYGFVYYGNPLLRLLSIVSLDLPIEGSFLFGDFYQFLVFCLPSNLSILIFSPF
jgi:hypothetical protein